MLAHVLISALVAVLIGFLFGVTVGYGGVAAIVTFIVLLLVGLLGRPFVLPGRRI